MSNRIIIFDTTLRDGEQTVGVNLNPWEKLQIARQLVKLGVNVIEAGFPVSSPGDFTGVRLIAQQVKGVVVAALARTKTADINCAWEAIKGAERPRIHTFIATSDIHLKHKLKCSRQEALEAAVAAVKLACSFTNDVEFSAEDATRSDWDYLRQIVEAVIQAGATTVNLPDTVGYTAPEEYKALIAYIFKNVPNINQAVVSVHCHNDLGLAVANSLAAVSQGARQVECTINGLGERAGNASLEEFVMAVRTRHSLFPWELGIETTQIYPTSRLVSSLTGMMVQRNKAIVGENAFAHEAGIHQAGMLANPLAYEIMIPESVGQGGSSLVLGKHAGKKVLNQRLRELGFKLSKEELQRAFILFKELADKKKDIFDEDLIALINDEFITVPETFILEYVHITSGSQTVPTALVRLRMEGSSKQDAAYGDGPVDAVFKAIDHITGLVGKLLDYSVNSVTKGKDAMGEVRVRVQINGGEIMVGKAASTDIIEASAKAYLNAINRYLANKG